MLKILFVCTGNTCRSAMAHHYMQYKIKTLKLDNEILVDSCGICTSTGQKATLYATCAIKKYNVDMSVHRAKNISDVDLNFYDYIFTMTKSQKEELLYFYKNIEKKVFTLGEFTNNNDIVDPYGFDISVYEKCAMDIVKAVDDLINILKRKSAMIVIGSDHAGIDLKEKIKDYLKTLEIEYFDASLSINSKEDDYPDIAKAVTSAVLEKNCLGIAICGTGIGISIACNKVKKIRAALCTSKEMAEFSRKHNDANILCLGARLETSDIDNIKEIVRTFLDTKFEGERHQRRIDKISALERGDM